MAETGNGIRFTREISLSTIIQAVTLVITAMGFWAALSARLDVLETKLVYQGNQINDLKGDIKDLQSQIYTPRIK
jgi:hypothetical protein